MVSCSFLTLLHHQKEAQGRSTCEDPVVGAMIKLRYILRCSHEHYCEGFASPWRLVAVLKLIAAMEREGEVSEELGILTLAPSLG